MMVGSVAKIQYFLHVCNPIKKNVCDYSSFSLSTNQRIDFSSNKSVTSL